jgi:RES domain
MAAAGEPLARFPRGLLWINLPAGEILIRVHHWKSGPIHFGPSPPQPPKNRFDAPHGEYRILYAAAGLEGAFVETILRNPRRVLRRAFVEERVWTGLGIERTLTIAKIFDEGLHFHGVDAGMIGTDDYTVSRELALALYQKFPKLDGLGYRSRYNNGEICYALFDRVAQSHLKKVNGERFDAIPDRVDQLMLLHGAVFDTSAPV